MIIDNVNAPLSHKLASQIPSAPATQVMLQSEAAATVVDGRLMPTQWEEVQPAIADANASTTARQASKVDATNPARAFRKQPDMPKPANLKDIKVSM